MPTHRLTDNKQGKSERREERHKWTDTPGGSMFCAQIKSPVTSWCADRWLETNKQKILFRGDEDTNFCHGICAFIKLQKGTRVDIWMGNSWQMMRFAVFHLEERWVVFMTPWPLFNRLQKLALLKENDIWRAMCPNQVMSIFPFINFPFCSFFLFSFFLFYVFIIFYILYPDYSHLPQLLIIIPFLPPPPMPFP